MEYDVVLREKESSVAWTKLDDRVRVRESHASRAELRLQMQENVGRPTQSGSATAAAHAEGQKKTRGPLAVVPSSERSEGVFEVLESAKTKPLQEKQQQKQLAKQLKKSREGKGKRRGNDVKNNKWLLILSGPYPAFFIHIFTSSAIHIQVSQTNSDLKSKHHCHSSVVKF
ncbi:hypothetical protein L6164_015915 [Bauhinia variegata]|uniref:Uncharacterized protein n=1 Tax=Bauhinia variegata TaxID=167791 RepID=A0ACB9NM68_BAUVA|nr:hypothetical protein L6164_015915 [Bauhinia variegata]